MKRILFFAIVCLFLAGVFNSQSSALATLAASMQPGTWATLSTTNITSALTNTGGSSNSIFGYSESSRWDPITRRNFYMGSDHGGGSAPGPNAGWRFVNFDDASNAWSILPTPPWLVFNDTTYNDAHGYDHTAINSAGRIIYRRPYNANEIRTFNIDTGAWGLAPAVINTGSSCCDAIDFFPDLGPAGSLIWNRATDSINRLDVATQTWSLMDSANSHGQSGTWLFAEYNPVQHVMLIGSDASKRLYKISSSGVVTRQADFPINIEDSSAFGGVVTVDPVSGTYLMLQASVHDMYEYNVVTDTFTLSTHQPPAGILTNKNVVAAPISTYGVVMFTYCDLFTNCGVLLYKHSASMPPPPVDVFTTKCAQPGVIKCFGFDSPTELYYAWDSTQAACNTALAGKSNNQFGPTRIGPGNTIATVQNGQCVYPTIDTSMKNAGVGALKFVVASNSGSDSSGSFTEPFKRNADGTFPYIAPGSPLGNVAYMQFYQRFDTNFLSNVYQCGTDGTESCGGWKQVIWYGNPPNGSSSSLIEVTHNDGNQKGIPMMYGQQGHDDYGYHDIRGCFYNFNGLNTYPEPPCIRYKPNQWMEFTVRVEVRGAPNAPESRVQLWVDGSLAIDVGFAKINWGSTDGQGLGAFEITPYHTRKYSGQAHPAATTWVDSLIISTQPIAMVTGSSPPPTAKISAYTANPHYPQNASGKPLFLLGFGNEDKSPSTVLDQLQGKINYLRAYAVMWLRTTDANAYIGGRPHPTVAGKMDMDQWNETYWTNLKNYVAAANIRGINVGLTIWDGHTTIPGGKFGIDSVWNAQYNMQGIQWAYDANALNTFPNPQPTGGPSERLVYYQRRWVDRLVTELSAYPNVLIELNNEDAVGSSESWWLWWAQYFKNQGFLVAVNEDAGGLGAVSDGVFGASSSLGMKSYHTRSDTAITSGRLAYNKIIVGDADNSCANLDADTARKIAWQSLLRGGHWNDFVCGAISGYPATPYPDTTKLSYYGYLLSFLSSRSVPFEQMGPSTVSSAGLSLVKSGTHYLIYPDTSASFTVNLSATSNTFNYEWYDPTTGQAAGTGTVQGGATRTFTAPQSRDVLWLTVGTAPLPATPISNVVVSSGSIYPVVTGMATGQVIYTDRAYTFSSLPAAAQNQTYIRTANDDKANTSASFLTFTLSQNATVYVAHDDRITAKPAWMSGFVDSGLNVVTTDATLSLYQKSFTAGTVTLGGNTGGSFSMYSVIVVPGNVVDTIPPVVTLSSIPFSGTITLSASASDNVGVVGVQFKVDGVNIGAEDLTIPFSVSWNTATVVNGTHTITAVARDVAGNMTTSAPVAVNISN